MKLVIDRDEMISALLLVDKGRGGSEAVDDAYTHILLRSAAGETWLEATNGVSWLRSRVYARAEGEFEIMLKSSAFSGLVKSLPEGDAEFAFSDGASGRLSVRAGQFNGWFPFRDGIDFPQVKHLSNGGVLIPGAAFRSSLKQVAFAEGKDPGRPALHGIRLETEPGSLRLCALNGAQLASSWTEIEGVDKHAWTIQADFASKLAKMAAEGDLTLSGSGTSITARNQDVWLTSRVYDNPFPDWRNGGGVPGADKGTARAASRKELLKAVERAVAVNSKAKRTPAVLLTGGDKGIMVSCNLDGYGSKEVVQARIVGQTHPIGDKRSVNGVILAQVLSSSDAEEVKLIFYENENLALDIRMESKKPVVSMRHLIMPYWV